MAFCLTPEAPVIMAVVPATFEQSARGGGKCLSRPLWASMTDRPVHNLVSEFHDDRKRCPMPPSSEYAAVNHVDAYEVPVERPEPTGAPSGLVVERAD